MTNTKYKSQESYNDRMKRHGFVKVAGWVPADKREDFLDHAFDLRVKHAKKEGINLTDL